MTVLGFVLLIAPSMIVVAQWSTGTNINNTNSGTVSVGTTNPGGDKLIAAGNVLAGNITGHTQLYSTYDSQSNPLMEVGYGTATANITPLPYLVLSKNLTSTNNPIGVIAFANSSIANGNDKRIGGITSWTDGATNSGLLQFLTSSAGTFEERMRITSGGNIGIGTTTPAGKLDVSGSLVLSGNAYTNGPSVSNSNDGLLLVGGTSLGVRINNQNNTAELMRVANSGNVGIGTGAPLGRLHIVTPSYTDTSVPAWDNHFFVVGGDSNTGGIALAYNQTTNTGYLQSLSPNVAYRNTVIAPFGGNVGIGNTTPNSAYKLDVTGNTNVTGNLNASGTITGGTINAKYQDVAEWVESSQVLSAGTVVVLDHTKSNQVIASSQAYDTRVAGVVSLQPGITLGEKSESKVLVATTGRVRIKVDASHGPINIGDLLVTSDVPGIAMKSQPIDLGGVRIHRPGTLIGKALEPLASGTGEILTLLSLQ
jgi:hypothetical protein